MSYFFAGHYSDLSSIDMQIITELIYYTVYTYIIYIYTLLYKVAISVGPKLVRVFEYRISNIGNIIWLYIK